MDAGAATSTVIELPQVPGEFASTRTVVTDSPLFKFTVAIPVASSSYFAILVYKTGIPASSSFLAAIQLSVLNAGGTEPNVE